MTTWKIGFIINAIVGMALFLFPFLILSNALPDADWISEVERVIIRSKVFVLGREWWRFVAFLGFTMLYLGMSVFLPIWVLGRSIKELDPRTNISAKMFTVYTLLFGLFTAGGLFFLFSLFTIKESLWRERELRFRNFEGDVDEDRLFSFEDGEERFDEQYNPYQQPQPVPAAVIEEVPSYEREVREEIRERGEKFNNNDVSRKLDRFERRLDGVEDDLYHERRKNRKVNKTLDDIEDILSKR